MTTVRDTSWLTGPDWKENMALASNAKYDKHGRPLDGSPPKHYMLTRPHGRGSYRYDDLGMAERNAERLAAENSEPILLWKAVAEFEITSPPVARRDLET